MTMKQLSFSIFLFALSFCCSCQDRSRAKASKSITTTKEIPINENGKQARHFTFVKMLAEKLSLDNLEDGFDSLQVRIWLSPKNSDSVLLILVKNSMSSVMASFSKHKIFFEKSRTSIDSIVSSSEDIHPKSGSRAFLENLVKLDICTLPDMQKTALNGEYTDVGGIAIEVSGEHFYRFYRYIDPFAIDGGPKEIDKLRDIISYVEKEFPLVWR